MNIFLPLSEEKKKNPSTKFSFLKYMSVSHINEGGKDIVTY